MGYSKEELEKTVGVLAQGGVILYPTDTVWGLGCDATQSEAVQKLSALKGDRNGPYIVAIDNDGRLYNMFQEIPTVAWDIIDLADRPTSLILPGAKGLAPEVLAADGSAGVRVIEEPFVKAVIRKLGKPIVSTSANQTGETVASRFSDIPAKIRDGVDYSVDYRREEHLPNRSSAIIKLGLNGEVKIIR